MSRARLAGALGRGLPRATGLVAGTCLVLAVALGGCTSTPVEQQAIERGRGLIELELAADAAYVNGEYQDASARYLELARALPDNADVWYRLANTQARLGSERQAVRAYQRSLDLDPSNSRAWYNLGLLLHRQSLSAFARGHARAAGADRSVEQESLRVLRILGSADRAIRENGREGAGLEPVIGIAPAPQEVDEDEDTTQ